MRVRHLLFVVLLLCLGGCEKPRLVVPEPGDLSGYWDVYHIKFDDTLIRTTTLLIEQSADSVWFLDETGTVSRGVIVADTIRCTDMYYLGVYRIFIDDNSHLHSEPPLAEYYKRLDFVRHGHGKSIG